MAHYTNCEDTGSQDTGITNPKYNSKDATSTTSVFLVRGEYLTNMSTFLQHISWKLIICVSTWSNFQVILMRSIFISENEKTFTHVDTTLVRQVYNKTKNRVIIIDLN